MHLSHIGEVVNDKYIKLNVSERKMLDALRIWLFSFFPLHVVAGRTFVEIYSKINPNPFNKFIEVEAAVTPLLQTIKKNINVNYPKRT